MWLFQTGIQFPSILSLAAFWWSKSPAGHTVLGSASLRPTLIHKEEPALCFSPPGWSRKPSLHVSIKMLQNCSWREPCSCRTQICLGNMARSVTHVLVKWAVITVIGSRCSPHRSLALCHFVLKFEIGYAFLRIRQIRLRYRLVTHLLRKQKIWCSLEQYFGHLLYFARGILYMESAVFPEYNQDILIYLLLIISSLSLAKLDQKIWGWLFSCIPESFINSENRRQKAVNQKQQCLSHLWLEVTPYQDTLCFLQFSICQETSKAHVPFHCHPRCSRPEARNTVQ